jgi:peptide/nickel transport system permease protein
VVAGLGFVGLLIVVALAAPLIAPQDPTRQALRGRLGAPTLDGVDGRAHLLGTDHLGRDVLSRVIYGSQVSLLVGFSAVVVGGVLGAAAGILADLGIRKIRLLSNSTTRRKSISGYDLEIVAREPFPD